VAISQNTAVVSTGGTMIDATATAYDQYGRGMVGKTVTFEVGGVDKLTATTGADGNAVYSYVACTANGISAVSTDNSPADMATIAATTPGAAGVRGTTVYCVTAATDGAFADTGGQTDIQTITWSANPTDGDFTVACGSATSASIAGEASAGDIQTALRLVTELDLIAVTETSVTLLTLVNPIADGDICTVVVTLTGGSHTIAANGTQTQAGITNKTYDIIEHDATANTIVVERLIPSTTPVTTMLQYTYDSTDKLTTAAVANGGATEAVFEAALHAEAESDNEEISGSYRTGALTTGISTFVVG